MTGFEPRTPGVGSNRSTNWATTTTQPNILLGTVLLGLFFEKYFSYCLLTEFVKSGVQLLLEKSDWICGIKVRK